MEEIPIIEEVRKENDLKEVKIERTDINDKKIENKKKENIEMEKDTMKEEPVKEERCVEDETLFKEVNTEEVYSSYSVYIVREGDTVDSIINKYSIDKEKLQEYNDLKELKIGDKLIIPSNV